MSKRKQSNNEDSDDGSSDVSLIDVDFDFFDPNPNVDYHAIKRLLSQLFQRDADLFHLHELTELILSQPAVGTTIKTDGIESDPYAILTVLNMHDHPSIKALAAYYLQKSSHDAALHGTLETLFTQTQTHVGFVFCERLINMPVQVIPPMYRMLADELKWAVGDNEPFNLSHLIFVSRTYHLTADEESFLASSTPAKLPTSKKSKKAKSQTQSVARPVDGIYPFHPEDEVIRQAATHTIDYTFSAAPAEPREKDAFGLDNRGRLMLVPAERLSELVAKMAQVYAV